MTSRHPWKVMFSRAAARRAGVVAGLQAVLLGLLIPLAYRDGRWILLLAWLALAAICAAHGWRGASVRVLTSPDGVHVVNRWRTLWLPWGDIEGIEVDTSGISADLLSRLDKRARERVESRPDLVVIDPHEGPRLLRQARLRLKSGVTVPVDAATREVVSTLGGALSEHRTRTAWWPWDQP